MKRSIVCLCLAAALLLGGCVTQREIDDLRAMRATWVTDETFRYEDTVFRLFPFNAGKFLPVFNGQKTDPIIIADKDVPLLLLKNSGENGRVTAARTLALADGVIYTREDEFKYRLAAQVDAMGGYYKEGVSAEFPVGADMRQMLIETLLTVSPFRRTGDGSVMYSEVLFRYSEGGEVCRIDKDYYFAAWLNSRLTLYYKIPDRYREIIEKAR